MVTKTTQDAVVAGRGDVPQLPSCPVTSLLVAPRASSAPSLQGCADVNAPRYNIINADNAADVCCDTVVL